MTENLIASDQRLDPSLQPLLDVVLNTLLPPSADGRLPGADNMDMQAYCGRTANAAGELQQALLAFAENSDNSFIGLPTDERVVELQRFSAANPQVFNQLLRHAYACYYQDSRVLAAIGLGAAPPFPEGNSIAAGDLSLLDPVVSTPRSYRR